MKINHLPLNDTTNGWSNILSQRVPHAALKDTIKADWLVIGGGFAGLAAARRLAENKPNDTIVLVEAGICGENASGRNSGFLIDIPHTTSSDLDQLNASHRYLKLARSAVGILKSVVDEHGIECDWSQDGKYQTAVTPKGRETMLVPFAKELAALDEPFEWVEGADLYAKLGTRHFTSAVYTPGCILLNPAALTRGLADSLPENVTIYENTPIVEFNTDSGVLARTPHGCIQAAKVILAANGMSERFGVAHRQFVHLALHASLSRQLTIQERKDYNVAAPWGVTPANAFGGITMRYTNDHRLLIRQEITMNSKMRITDTYREGVKKRHKAMFDDRYPNLPNVTMDHTWTGFICMSRNGAPAFDAVAPNMWIAACQNGIGVTKGTLSGHLIADVACGNDSDLIQDMRALGKPTPLPPRPLVEIGARTMIRWETWKNRAES